MLAPTEFFKAGIVLVLKFQLFFLLYYFDTDS